MTTVFFLFLVHLALGLMAMLPFVPDRAGLVAAYQSCDILLFPSRLEGFGIAFIAASLAWNRAIPSPICSNT